MKITKLNVGLTLFFAVWFGYLFYDKHQRTVERDACLAKGGHYLNVGFEKYGCYKLTEVR